MALRIRPYIRGFVRQKFGNPDESYDKRIQKMNDKKYNNKIS